MMIPGKVYVVMAVWIEGSRSDAFYNKVMVAAYPDREAAELHLAALF